VISTVELSELLFDLYSAPLQTHGWQSFFDRLCNLCELSVGYLHCCRPNGHNFVLAGGGANFAIENIDLYNKHFAVNDPHRAPLDSNPRVGTIQGEELIERTRFVHSELYNDLLAKHDAEYLTVLTTDSDRKNTDVFSLYRGRSRGQMDRATLEQLEILIPHVRNAFALDTQISESHSFKLLSETVMESKSIAALQATGNARVKYANRLAVRYLHDGNGLRQCNKVLFAVDAATNERLHTLIAHVANCARDRVSSAPGGALQVSRRTAETPLKVTVIPAPREHRLASPEPSALVFVSDLDLPIRSRTSILQQLYGLSPTEARVAGALVQGLELREIAELRSITYETARFHLKRLMIKTGTRRQRDLIRLVLSLPGQL
jgi:DNA-binding CsgD family transcriptional regulator